MKQQKLLRLVESGLMLAAATVLSMVKVLELPYGGSITAFSALPLLLIAYRHGVKWGLFTAFAHALLQLLLGASTLSYATSAGAAVAIIMLDYLLAFTALGLGGLFRRPERNQGSALVLGALLTGVLRYACHVIAGCTVWAGLSIPTTAALTYSLAYNATYMIPEIVVTVLGAVYLSRVVDLREQIPTRAKAAPVDPFVFWVGLVGKAALLVASVWSVAKIFAPLQDPETGDFAIQNLALVNWPILGAVLVGALALWAVTNPLLRKIKQ